MLDQTIKKICNTENELIKAGNIKGEMAEFGNFLSQVLQLSEPINTCYARELENMKQTAKEANQNTLDGMLSILNNIFYFSYGHDMVYKEKIKAGCFMHEILPIIQVEMETEIKELFNDLSVIPENSKYQKNIEAITSIVAKHRDFNSLLFLLYVNEWQFPSDWQKLYPQNAHELEIMINQSNITIGDFLNALVEFKIVSIKDVFLAIENPKLREDYLHIISGLEAGKKKEVANLGHIHLPVGYFNTNTMQDFVKNPKPSSPNSGTIILN